MFNKYKSFYRKHEMYLLFWSGVQVTIHIEIIVTILDGNWQLGVSEGTCYVGNLSINRYPGHGQKGGNAAYENALQIKKMLC